MSDLPRRPFTPLTAPDGGADAAVVAGRRRRQRRRAVGVGLTTVAAVAVGVVLAPGGGSPGAARLVTASPSTTPSASSSPAPSATVSAVSTTPSPAAGDRSASPSAPHGSPAMTAAATAAAATSYRAGPLVRSYVPPVPAGGRVCGPDVAGTGDNVQSHLGWCVHADVTARGAGHDLAVVVCRDQTTDAGLHLPAGLPAELTVSAGSQVVWRWSPGQPPEPAEVLATAAGACWTWTTAWTDVDGAGRPLPDGDYTLVGTTHANELAQLPDSQPVTFTI